MSKAKENRAVQEPTPEKDITAVYEPYLQRLPHAKLRYLDVDTVVAPLAGKPKERNIKLNPMFRAILANLSRPDAVPPVIIAASDHNGYPAYPVLGEEYAVAYKVLDAKRIPVLLIDIKDVPVVQTVLQSLQRPKALSAYEQEALTWQRFGFHAEED